MMGCMSAGNGTFLARGAAAFALVAVALAGCAPPAPPPPPDPPPAPPSPTSEPIAGWAVHDSWPVGNGQPQNIDGVSCDSPDGPWHLVFSGDLAAFGLSSLDAYYDVTFDPATGIGPVTGKERSVTTDGDVYAGGSTGTATRTEEGDGYLIRFETDFKVIWTSPNIVIMPGQETLTGHVSREASIIPATSEECG
jgi:hypothetical protein